MCYTDSNVPSVLTFCLQTTNANFSIGCIFSCYYQSKWFYKLHSTVYQGICKPHFTVYQGICKLPFTVYQGICKLHFTVYQGICKLHFTVYQGIYKLHFTVYQGILIPCLCCILKGLLHLWQIYISHHQNTTIRKVELKTPQYRRVWRYQRGNQNPYNEEEQTTQRPKEKVQKNKQRSTKHTYKTIKLKIE